MLISLAVGIHGDLLDPEEITAILEVTPHASWRNGESRTTGTGKVIVSKGGLWEWHSKDISNVMTINDHIGRLRDTFEHVFELIPKLPNVDMSWVDVHVVVGNEEENVSNIWLLMDVEAIAVLSKIGLPVELTVDILPPRDSS